MLRAHAAQAPPQILQPVLAGASILLADRANWFCADNGLYVKPRNAAACGHAPAESTLVTVPPGVGLGFSPGRGDVTCSCGNAADRSCGVSYQR